MRPARCLVAVAGVAIAAAAAASVAGRRRFERYVDDQVAVLFGQGAVIGPSHPGARYHSLPPPVGRYLRHVIPERASGLATARLTHDGTFRTSPRQGWFDIKGEQYFTVPEPGFVWKASIRPAPLVWIEACDSLVAGRGRMLVKFMSTIAVADAIGTEIDQGARLRWLAECPWFPYAFVGDQIQWASVDDRTARATLAGGNPPVSATFEFAEDGLLAGVRAERYRDVGGGRAVLTPWRGRYADYRDFSGFRIPTSVDVSWEVDGQSFSYARFRVTFVDYNVARRFR